MRWSLTLYQMSGLLLTCPAWCWAALWKWRGPPRSECCPQWAWPSLMCGRCGLHLWRSHRRRPFHPCSCRCPLNWTSYCYGCWPPRCCCCWERSSEAWGCWVETSRPRDLPTWHTTWWQTTGLIWTGESDLNDKESFLTAVVLPCGWGHVANTGCELAFCALVRRVPRAVTGAPSISGSVTASAGTMHVHFHLDSLKSRLTHLATAGSGEREKHLWIQDPVSESSDSREEQTPSVI